MDVSGSVSKTCAQALAGDLCMHEGDYHVKLNNGKHVKIGYDLEAAPQAPKFHFHDNGGPILMDKPPGMSPAPRVPHPYTASSKYVPAQLGRQVCI